MVCVQSNQIFPILEVLRVYFKIGAKAREKFSLSETCKCTRVPTSSSEKGRGVSSDSAKSLSLFKDDGFR